MNNQPAEARVQDPQTPQELRDILTSAEHLALEQRVSRFHENVFLAALQGLCANPSFVACAHAKFTGVEHQAMGIADKAVRMYFEPVKGGE